MPTNINFVGQLDSEGTTQVNFNLPKTLSLGTVKKSFNNSGISEAEGCSYLTLNGLNQTALLGKASLVINPSSFSENAVYADLPANSTLGDLTFTRATDAWRTNSSGLVQRVAWNLLYSSEQFVGTWSTGGATITANVTTAPNGTLTADTFFITSAAASYIYRNAAISVPTFTASLYVKYVDRQFIQVLYGSGLTQYANFDLINGTVTGGSYTGATISNASNGWFRISLTTTGTTPGSVDTYIWAIDAGNSLRAAANNGSGSYYIWGAQLTEGSSALEYFPTTDRQDVPRIDYSLGGCPTLLMEPQRTNLLTYSEELSNAIWQNIGLTITNNTIAAPSGIVNADTLVATTANTQHSINQNIVVTTGSTLTLSCYVKNNGGNFVQLIIGAIGFTIVDPYQNFNLQTGTLANGNIPTSTITNVGNSWYRITSTVTTAEAGTASFFVSPILSGTTGRVNSFVGDGINGIYAWGVQLEVSAYSTSYIPTTSASVTRNQDLASKAGISSLLGQTEGTILTKINVVNTVTGVQGIINITNDNLSSILYTNYLYDGRVGFDFYVGGVYTHGLLSPAALPKGVNSYAIVYKAGDYKLFINGVLAVTNSNSTPITNTISRIGMGTDQAPMNYNSIVAFKTALSDGELELLTGNYFDSYAKMAAFYNYTLQ